jgi:hypothetical protein
MRGRGQVRRPSRPPPSRHSDNRIRRECSRDGLLRHVAGGQRCQEGWSGHHRMIARSTQAAARLVSKEVTWNREKGCRLPVAVSKMGFGTRLPSRLWSKAPMRLCTPGPQERWLRSNRFLADVLYNSGMPGIISGVILGG